MNATATGPGAVALDGLCDGFADITHQSQRVFRQVLAAMAEPGTVHSLEAFSPESQPTPAPLSSAAYQVCLALLDQDTPLWLEPGLASAAVTQSLRFHCGCGMAAQPRDAVFALVTAAGAGPLAQFDQGTFEYPDRSATVIVEVDGFAEGAQEGLQDGDEWVLEGPGIRGQRRVQINGLDERWQQALAENHRAFPCGVDLILTAGSQLMALPRTTRTFHGAFNRTEED